MIECNFKYSIERYNSKTDKWEIEYRFYYRKFTDDEIYKDNDTFRNFKFVEELNMDS